MYSTQKDSNSLFQLFDNDRHMKPMSDEDEEMESRSEEVGGEKNGTTWRAPQPKQCSDEDFEKVKKLFPKIIN